MLKKFLHLLLVGLLAGLALSGCVISEDDPCDGIDCDGHGTCIEYQGEAMCDCDDGYMTSEDLIHCEPAGYTVGVTWSFSDAADCSVAQVASIDVTLLQGTQEITSANISCDAGGADIEQIDDGSYTIELRANSNAGELTYYGEGSVTVSGQDANLNIEMEPIGYVVFTWDMGGETCTVADVDRVTVTINTEDGSETLYTADPVPDCDDGGHSTEDTAFFFMGTYNLVLEGQCHSNLQFNYNYDATMVISEKGENNYGNLSLNEVGGGC